MSSSLRRVEVSADGSRLFLLYQDRLVVHDLDSGTERDLAIDLTGDEGWLVVSLDGSRAGLRCGRQLKILDTATGALVRVWPSEGSSGDAHPQMMPDGRLILDPRADGVYLVDIDTAELRMRLPTPWRPSTIRVSPDGRWVEADSNRWGDAWLEGDVEQSVRWDTTTGTRMHFSASTPASSDVWVRGHGPASVTAFMPDLSGIVAGFRDGLLGIRYGKQVRWLTGHVAAVTALAVAPDGETIVSGSQDGTVQVCRLKTGAGFAATFHANAPIVKCLIPRDGKTLLIVDENGSVNVLTELLDAPMGLSPLDMALSPIEWVLAPDGNSMFLLYPGRLVLRDVDSGTGRTIVAGLWGNEKGLVASLDARRVSLRCGAELRIWDVERGSVVRAWPAVLDEGVQMMPDGYEILDRPGGALRGLGLFDVDTGKLKIALSEKTPAEPVQVSADGRWVAALTPAGKGPRQFAIWDASDGKAFDFAGPGLESGQFRGHWFAAIDTGAAVWDLWTGARVFYRGDYKRPFTALAVMPDDRGMAVAFGDGRLGIWDLTGESEVRRLPGHSAGIKAIAVTPDGRAILSTSSDGVLQVCEVGSGAVIARHRVEGPIRDCVIRPDGKTVVAVEETGRVQILRNLMGA